MAERPLGVTIISILGFIGAIIGIIAGIAFSALGGILGGVLGPLSALGYAAGAIVLILGIIQFAASYGLLKMRKWAFYIEIVLLIIGLAGGVSMAFFNIGSGAVQIIISIIILYYLYLKRDLFS